MHRRSSCFIADDDDSSSFSSSVISLTSPHHRSHTTVSSLRSFNGRLYYEPKYDNRHSHFLNTCSLCKKSIGDHMDIFMYRGDTPFCSEECRQEQIDMDEASEMKLKVSSGMKTTSSGGNNKYSIRTSTVAAA